MIMAKVGILLLTYCLLASVRFYLAQHMCILTPLCFQIIGGTFALYSLICRYAKVHMLPNRQPADEHISSFKLKLPTPELERALRIKEALETIAPLKTLLLFLVLTGTSMIIGDGILTPAMSGALLPGGTLFLQLENLGK